MEDALLLLLLGAVWLPHNAATAAGGRSKEAPPGYWDNHIGT